jgi:hypothetical protein
MEHPMHTLSPKVCFQKLETEINDILRNELDNLMADRNRVAHFAQLFDRTSENNFYSGAHGPQGIGEQPTWAPNPAYMDSLEELWIPVEEKLRAFGLGLEKTLRELFYLSHEYKDQDQDHRRVFHGQLVDRARGIPVTYFMINIPHSHAGFQYLVPPAIQIAPLL